MKPEELQKDFLPKAIVLKLALDIPRENYTEKLEILDHYINQVKDSLIQTLYLSGLIRKKVLSIGMLENMIWQSSIMNKY